MKDDTMPSVGATVTDALRFVEEWEAVDRTLTEDVVVWTPSGHSNVASHARRLAATLRALVAERDQLKARVADLEGELAFSEDTRTRMRDLLNGVADALHGPAQPLHAHDWSDLPARATALRETLREVAHSGVESDDPRIGYVTVQVDRPTWQAVQEGIR